MKTSAIVVAAGRGTRMGATAGKGFLTIGGLPMVVHSLRTLARLPGLLSIVLVVGASQEERATEVLKAYGPWPVPVRLAHGGAERQDSVAAGLASIETNAELVLVHDAARPFVSLDSTTACIKAAASRGAAILAVPAHDTVKVADAEAVVTRTLDRATIWLAQTPQVFHASLLRRAYAQAQREGCVATDDAMLVERLGVPVRLVPGEPANRKITTPDDLEWAEWYVQTR